MVLKRTETDDSADRGGSTSTMIETLRSSRDSSQPRTKSEEDKMSVFWRVFGGTLLSIAALAAITLFNSVTGNITELRAEVSRLNESKAEWAKKDDVQTLRTQVTTHAGYRAEIDSLKERAAKYRVEFDETKKEFRTAHDGLRKDVGAIDSVKEKQATVALDLKVALDETMKLRQELEKNQAADLARRDIRDAQMRKLDETLKEQQKALGEAREKIARLEGQQTPMKSGVPAKSD